MLSALLIATLLESAAGTSPTVATIYVYRPKELVSRTLHPSIYCDDRELGQMQAGRRFVVSVPPGRHIFRSNVASAAVTIDARSGETYYVKVAAGFLKGRGRLELTAPDQGREEVQRLKPSDQKMVKDSDDVDTPRGDAPAGASQAPRPIRSSKSVTNEDVMRLATAGISENAIIAKIQTSRTAFKTDTDDLIALKQAGVSNRIIEVIVTRK